MAVFILLSAGGLSSAGAAETDDSRALQGLTEVRAIFDMNVGNPEELLFYLQVIQKTYEGLIDQGQKADCIVAIRGGAVRLVTTETWSFEEEDQKRLEEAAAIIAQLSREGVRFEVCSLALGLFKVDKATLIPDVNPVGNTFISLIGYQTKGYVVIPVK